VKKGFQVTPEDRLIERAYLVGVSLPRTPIGIAREHLEELHQLAITAGAEVVGSTIQGRTRIEGVTFIGTGKAEQLKGECEALGANLVIFDSDLSPAQARNLEKILNISVIDRTELILDIFARHAKTEQAKTQVELAQLIYSLPRLRKLWGHLSRQQGGIGARGPGETQLEVDRRRVRDRIGRLKKRLKTFEKRSEVVRESRNGHPTVALVGYTNAGKSTLMSALTGAETFAADQLFATLDTLTRRLDPKARPPVLIIDTVGFIRKLPHHLVESFKATLGDIERAELCLHVIDAAHPAYADQKSVAEETLHEIKGDSRTIDVFNKIDLVGDEVLAGMRQRYPDAVFVCARNKQGLDELRDRIDAALAGKNLEVEVRVRATDGKGIAQVKSMLHTPTGSLENGYCVFKGRIDARYMNALERLAGVRVRYLF
jgi:GTP-binding protein HflX